MEDGKNMNKFNILYEDNHIIVVVKPPNILSQADDTRDMDMVNLIKHYIKEKYKKPGNVYVGLVHRLDRPTEGILVFAKTSKAASRLSKQVQNHTMKKKYLAVVNNKLSDNKGIFQDYLLKNKDGNTKVTTKEEGKFAELSYKMLSYHKKENKTLVEIELKTGRHHQIRVQFASRGYPLCGDQRYGKQDKTQLALVAYHLEFYHPTTKELLRFTYHSKNNSYMSIFTM